MDAATQDIYRALANLDEVLKRADFHQISLAVSKMISEENAHTILSSMLTNANVRYKNSDLMHRLLHEEGRDAAGMTSIPMPVGLISSDDSAILGKEGFLFLVGGSNDVIGQYSPDKRDEFDVSDRWINLITSRLEQSASRGARYHQIIIPEKISILSDLFPKPVASPTRLLDLLEKECICRFGDAIHTSARHLFWSLADRRPAWKKTDSHLAPFGSFTIFKSFLRRLYGLETPELVFRKNAVGVGDLSFRLFGLFLPETFFEADPSSMPSFVHTAQKVSESSPEPGAHIGYRQVWHNPQAPIAEKVVVFGNSFFSLVENGQSNLSWWFSRWFRDFHFVWTNEVHWDYVEKESPQLVLWQGVERFLRIVPGQ